MQHTSINQTALSATLHCLTGCAIGEVTGLILGTALGWSNAVTFAVSIGLAFLFGYALSVWPLLTAGVPVVTALSTVLAADTLSIATMELVDNLVMAKIPGAMQAGLAEPLFWLSMAAALSVAFWAAFPVNRYLLQRGKGHALMHKFHQHYGHEDNQKQSGVYRSLAQRIVDHLLMREYHRPHTYKHENDHAQHHGRH